MIQLRERDLAARDLAALAERCVDAAARHSHILLNDRLDVALAARADGVHLRSDSVDPTMARAMAPQDFLIGRSAHSQAEAVEASRSGAVDYLLFGTIFLTPSKAAGHPTSGLEVLAQACAMVPIPVLAIGGITQDRVDAVAKSGAAGVAAIGLFIPSADVPFERHLEGVVETLRRAFDTCGAVP